MSFNNSSVVVITGSYPGFCFMSVLDFDPNDFNRTDSVHSMWTFIVAINCIAAPPTVLLNGFIIWVVSSDKYLRLSAFNLLLVSLSVTDFLMGLLIEPLFCIFLGCLVNGCYSPCQFTAFSLLLMVSFGMTMITLAIASVERYLAIERPIFYRMKITGKKVMAGTVIIWIVTLTSVLLITAYLNRRRSSLYKVPAMVVGGILSVVILYCTSKVHLTAYHHRRTISNQHASLQLPNEEQQLKKRRQEYKRMFIMTMFIVLSVSFCTPFLVVTAIGESKGKDFTRDFKYLSMPICVTFLHLQSLVNPMIMSLRLSYIRQRIKNILFC